MYSEQHATISMGGITSDQFQVASGVRQGDPLSPLLFNIFINSVLIKVQGESNIPQILAYADDIV